MSGKDAKITATSQFAASRDGVAILDALSRIGDTEVRRQIIDLAEKLAASTHHALTGVTFGVVKLSPLGATNCTS